MRWCGKPRDEWYVWFAWRPVRLTGTSQWVWLTRVERYFSESPLFVRNMYRELASWQRKSR